jgi:hypothetical protein
MCQQVFRGSGNWRIWRGRTFFTVLWWKKDIWGGVGDFLSSWCCCFFDFVISTIEWRNAFLTGGILGGEATRDIYIFWNYRYSCYFFLTTGEHSIRIFFYYSYILNLGRRRRKGGLKVKVCISLD